MKSKFKEILLLIKIKIDEFLKQFLDNFVRKASITTFRRMSSLGNRFIRKMILMLKIFHATDFNSEFDLEKNFKWKAKNIWFTLQECRTKEVDSGENRRKNRFSSLEIDYSCESSEKVELKGN
jgi:hypothetical protein